MLSVRLDKPYFVPNANLPSFMGQGSNVTVAVGRDASVTCKVRNLQIYKVAWLRVDTQTILSIGSHVITKNPRVGVTQGEGAWTLTLRDVALADGGRYMCQLNTQPMMSQVHRLQVVVPPDIDGEASSGDVTAREGAGVALRCLASGSPAPALTWRREDAAHFTLDGKVMVSKWTGEWLNISAVQRETSGAYLCIASNGVPPSVSKRIQVNVMFAPRVWAQVVAARAAAGSSPTLQCRAHAHPPPQTYWTLNGEQRLSNGSKYTMTTAVKDYTYTLSLRIEAMTRADAGAYRCHADNALDGAHADLFLHMETTTSTTTTTTTTTTPPTSTTPPPTTDTIPTSVSDAAAGVAGEGGEGGGEGELEQLHRGVLAAAPRGVLAHHVHNLGQNADDDLTGGGWAGRRGLERPLAAAAGPGRLNSARPPALPALPALSALSAQPARRRAAGVMRRDATCRGA
ncbi:PREDICTED: protein CEPU-1-like [Papilio polytes]|uniref:protein CEPU-1-like n=1 Tax=Papilio polytes TaxID=76194 RepID=UPI0006766709|nr:PREDICTED: protein CEPU-1-like [Papilio polytes]